MAAFVIVLIGVLLILLGLAGLFVSIFRIGFVKVIRTRARIRLITLSIVFIVAGIIWFFA